VKEKDRKWLDKAILGEPISKSERSALKQRKIKSKETFMAPFIRERLYELLKDI